MLLTPAQIKPKSFESIRKFFVSFLPGVDAPHVYVRAWAVFHSLVPILQALVYDILPSTTAVFSYATRSGKLSANEQLFVGAQTVVSLLQTTHIMSDICFINMTMLLRPAQKTTTTPKLFESRQNSFFYPGWMRLMFTCVLGR